MRSPAWRALSGLVRYAWRVALTLRPECCIRTLTAATGGRGSAARSLGTSAGATPRRNRETRAGGSRVGLDMSSSVDDDGHMEDALYPGNADEALYRANEATRVPFSELRIHHAHESACINADDTSVERDFEYQSPEWFACYAASLRFMLDTLPED